jgi:hypothetical protein
MNEGDVRNALTPRIAHLVATVNAATELINATNVRAGAALEQTRSLGTAVQQAGHDAEKTCEGMATARQAAQEVADILVRARTANLNLRYLHTTFIVGAMCGFALAACIFMGFSR